MTESVDHVRAQGNAQGDEPRAVDGPRAGEDLRAGDPRAGDPRAGEPRAGEPRSGADPTAAQVAQPDFDDDPPPPPRRKSQPRSWYKRLGNYLATIARGVYRKGAEDEIFFLAGAISFNVLVAFIPLVITVIGIAGIVLRFQGANAEQTLLNYLATAVPAVVNLDIAGILENLAEQSTGILSIGTLFFLWVATRLVGTLRVVLRDIFDIPEGRGIIAGKIFDIKMLLAAGTLFALNVALTLGLRLSADFGARVMHIDPDQIPFMSEASRLWPQIVAFITIWVMFLLIYRFLPPRRIKWSTALTAATFTAILGEALKFGFGYYVTGVADFRTTWGNIATFVILVIWVYYTAIVFVLGGEVAQVMSIQRTRRRQKERLA